MATRFRDSADRVGADVVADRARDAPARPRHPGTGRRPRPGALIGPDGTLPVTALPSPAEPVHMGLPHERHLRPRLWVALAGGLQLGAALGDFQDHVSAAATSYDIVYLDPASRKQGMVAVTTPGWAANRNLQGLRFNFTATATHA